MNRLFRMVEILLMAVLLSACSCSDDEALAIQHALAVYDSHPDSALAILRTIDRSELSGKNLATYSLAYSMAQDKSGLDVTSDSLLRFSFDYYMHRADDSLYAKCQYYMGKYYMLVDSMTESAQCLEKAISSSETSGDAYTEYLALEKLCYVLRAGNPEKAVKCALQAYDIYNSIPSRNERNGFYLLSNIGTCYGWAGNRKASLESHSKAIALAMELADSMLISKAYYGAAHSCLLLEKADAALQYAEKAYEYDTSAMLIYAMCLAETGNYSKAIPLFEKDFNSKRPIDKYASGKYLCSLTMKLHGMDSTCAYFDSTCVLYEQECQRAYAQQGKYYESSMLRLQKIEKLKASVAIREYIFLFVICLCLLVVAATIVFFIQKRKASKRQLLIEKRHSRQLLNLEREKLHLKEVQLDMMKKQLLDKLEFIRKLNDLHKDQSSSKIEISDAEWKEVEVFLEGVDNMFVTRFKERYPDLSEDDIQFVMLVRLGFKHKDFANYYCITERSVKQKHFKFKAKIGLNNPDISLKKYIQSF